MRELRNDNFGTENRDKTAGHNYGTILRKTELR
jgi:hypothetical protein